MKLQPPKHLSRQARAFWRQLQSQYRIEDPGRLALLQQATEAMDRAAAAREVIAREGVVKAGRLPGQCAVHPAVRVVDAAESSLRAALKLMALPKEVVSQPSDPFSEFDHLMAGRRK